MAENEGGESTEGRGLRRPPGRRRREPAIIEGTATPLGADDANRGGEAGEPSAASPFESPEAGREPEAGSGGLVEPALPWEAAVPPAAPGHLPEPGHLAEPETTPGAPHAQEAEIAGRDVLDMSDQPSLTEAVPAEPAEPEKHVDEPQAEAIPDDAGASRPAAETAAPAGPGEERGGMHDLAAALQADGGESRTEFEAGAGAEPPAFQQPPFEPPPPATETPLAAEPPPAAEPLRRTSPLALIFGVAAACLVGVILWLLATEQQRSGANDLATALDALKTRVATLEKRPDPSDALSQVQADQQQIAAVRTAADGVAKDLADLRARLDTVAAEAAAAQKAAVPAAAPADGTQAAATAGGAAPSPGGATGAGGTETVPAAAPPDLGPLTARIDDLQHRLEALAAAPAGASPPAAAAPAAPAPASAPDLSGIDAHLAALDQKVGDLSAAQKALPPPPDLGPVQQRLADLDGRIAALSQDVAGLHKDIAGLHTEVAGIPRVDLQPLQSTVAGLETRLGGIEAALSAPKKPDRVTEARAEGSTDTAKAAELAVLGDVVQRALDTGRPFADALASIKALNMLTPEDIAPLAALAEHGAPTRAALQDLWAQKRDSIQAALHPREGDGALDRLKAGALSLVHVRPVGAQAGEDPDSVTSRIEADLASGDLAGASAEWARLPEAARAAAPDFGTALAARVAADNAAARAVSLGVGALGRAKD